jgi:hypothetical protein
LEQSAQSVVAVVEVIVKMVLDKLADRAAVAAVAFPAELPQAQEQRVKDLPAVLALVVIGQAVAVVVQAVQVKLQ